MLASSLMPRTRRGGRKGIRLDHLDYSLNRRMSLPFNTGTFEQAQAAFVRQNACMTKSVRTYANEGGGSVQRTL
jgi:hypothetical protein